MYDVEMLVVGFIIIILGFLFLINRLMASIKERGIKERAKTIQRKLNKQYRSTKVDDDDLAPGGDDVSVSWFEDRRKKPREEDPWGANVQDSKHFRKVDKYGA